MKIPRDVVDIVFVQGEKEAPNEACGYLAGRGGAVVKAIPLTNADHSPDHFSLDPREQFAIVRRLRTDGLEVLAVYHSHPASPARPSVEDIRLAYDPDILYVIASLQGVKDIRAFRIREGSIVSEPILIEENPHD
jgi:[CysO sulfur-carrier protein]-S-L-cysteine hydrolase